MKGTIKVLCVVSGIISFIVGQPNQNLVTLQKCVKFKDERPGPSSDVLNMINYPRERPSDEPPSFILSGIADLDSIAACRIEVAQIISHSEGWPSLNQQAGATHSQLQGENARFGAYISKDGRYYDGLYYLNPSEFCIENIKMTQNGSHSYDRYIRLRVCQVSPLSQKEERLASCVPKCCAPNYIIDYETKKCRALKPDEPGWTPKLCHESGCSYENDFCRTSYGLPSESKCHLSTTLVPFSNNLTVHKGHGKLELNYVGSKSEWTRFNHPYCADGFVSKASDIFDDEVMHQVFVICQKHEQEINDSESSAAYNFNPSFQTILMYVFIKFLLF